MQHQINQAFHVGEPEANTSSSNLANHTATTARTASLCLTQLKTVNPP